MRRRGATAGFAVLLALFGIGVLEVRAQGETFAGWWAYYAIYPVAAGLVLARAMVSRRARTAWVAIGVGMLLYGAGSAYSATIVHFGEAAFGMGELPFPSVADALWLAFPVLAYAGLGLLLRDRIGSVPRSLWLDGLIGGLAVAALATALVFEAVVTATAGSPAEIAVGLAYPLADVLLLAWLAAALALTGWRMDRQWGLLLAGIVVFSAGDAVWLWLEATGGVAPTSALDLVWPAAFVLLAAAAWQRRPATAGGPSRRALLAGPIAFGLLATGLLVHGALAGLEVVPAALAGATLVAVLLRLALSFAENVALLEHAHAQSVTDQLTGLRNRRCLLADLERLLADEDGRAVLGLFDLNGFKAFNDAFGHLVGDVLLARLGRALAAAAEGHGQAYRLGGDEFCVLVDADAMTREALLTTCSAALSEAGDGYAITASAGLVLLPEEAADAAAALGLADSRMYARKRGRAVAVA